jgi:monomeric isocitrate dehydrogenase
MEDQEEENIEDQVETQQDTIQDYYDNSPSEQEKESIPALFWKVIQRTDSSKISNLDKYELGMLDMSVRDCQSIAVLCDLVEYNEVAKWLRRRSEIILATSSSKKGWLVELFVSAKKFVSKERSLGVPQGLSSQPEQKSGFWSKLKR